ncbi:glycosyltransferase [Roseimicrobium sp. ORNL1]|uniref:glycosyltransferase n=1 Tax=Roseimicrobium sp. ORNL1 TaxID=2711231 RepID=UPI0013E1DA39|nr:glycosyltransferase [Roseimicrobium sp. ORNL1]QIF05006.1 glycosyltransferase [Roseimicrobium sp. ORNL1]
MPIPHLLHQMWRDESLPERWATLRNTWIHHHPQWELRLWTDESLRVFVATHYPSFLEQYDGYATPIMRADAARYLVLQHFGGVYADLDMECLQPLEPLIGGKELLLPLEPDLHLQSAPATAAGMRRIVGNAWMASAPGHPFWERVITELRARRHMPGALESTGPFMLSAVVDACAAQPWGPELLPAETVYAVTNVDNEWLAARKPGSAHGFDRDVYSIHYWDGTWWRQKAGQTSLHLLRVGEPVVAGHLNEPRAAKSAARVGFTPLVSCLMVTGRRRHLSRLAVRMFQLQTYEHRELVVIDDSGQAPPADWGIDEDTRVRWITVPSEGKPLGALRNLALAEARGDFLCQWDDDDLSAPMRLERQVLTLFSTGADACGLGRLQLWWPTRDWTAISSSRVWECALMWRKGTIPAYPELRKGEDTPPVEALAARGRIALLDTPALYTYICHGENTFAEEHWLSLWKVATARRTNRAARLHLQLMQGTMPMHEYLVALGQPGLEKAYSTLPAVVPQSHTSVQNVEAGDPVSETLPAILIATPIKNAVPFLERYFQKLTVTDYPAEKLSLALVASDCTDATVPLTEKLLAEHASRFRRTALLQRDYGFHSTGERWSRELQRQRRSILAHARNALIEEALEDETWVLWIDVDVLTWPSDVIHRLLAAGRDLVTPHCVHETNHGPSFDLNTFVFRDAAQRDGQKHLHDGIYQPPVGVTRKYLDAFRSQDGVELDGVGGTMLLVKAALFRDGLRFPARPYRGFLETEGLAQMARDFGVIPWGLPQVEIIHP